MKSTKNLQILAICMKKCKANVNESMFLSLVLHLLSDTNKMPFPLIIQ